MNNKVTLEVGVKAFIVNDGKYLLLRRTKPYEGETFVRWDIPGGRINPGEATIDGLKREIDEETGLEFEKILSVLAAQDIQRVPGRHTVRITYLVTCKNPDKEISLDLLGPTGHDDYRWMSLEELQKEPHDIYLDPVLEQIQAE